MNENVAINKKFKDSVFCMLFGTEEYKSYALELFNALNGTSYEDVNMVEITTIRDAVYLHSHNDASCIVNLYANIWEQQSTINPNMPLREMQYYMEICNGYIVKRQLDKYGTAKITIPTPKCVVLYNGTKKAPERQILKLSDMFAHACSAPEYKWTCYVYNINSGCNEELLNSCKSLSGYVHLVNEVRHNINLKMSPVSAVNLAIDSCIKNGILVDFLSVHRAEVETMWTTDLDIQIHENAIRKEAEAQGETINLIRQVCKKISKNKSVAEIADALEEDESKIQSIVDIAVKYSPDFDAEKIFEELNS